MRILRGPASIFFLTCLNHLHLKHLIREKVEIGLKKIESPVISKYKQELKMAFQKSVYHLSSSSTENL